MKESRCSIIRRLLADRPHDLLEIAGAIGTDSRRANAFLQHLRRQGEAECTRRGDQGRYRLRPALWAARNPISANAERSATPGGGA